MRSILLMLTLTLAGCSAANETAATAPSTAATPTPAAQPAASAPTGPAPEAARRVPEELLTQDGVYYGCSVPADCAIKNVGNCCGYYPACVNKDSPTFPEQVKADCAKSGMNSICGFPSIAECDCLEGRCTAINGPAADPKLPLQ